MKDYLESLIIEQMNRALALKRLIPYPLRFPELSSLATRCTQILDDQFELLSSLREELSYRSEDDVRDILRELRMCTWEVQLVEYYGISALYYQTPEVGFLNKVVFKIHQEIRLPFPPPSICCTSTKYYYSCLFTNVIFVPLGESNFLLHLPDLYHEIGHYVLENRRQELRLAPVDRGYNQLFGKITNHYMQLLREKKSENSPPAIPIMIARIHSNWKNWINEYFCDLFGLYTAGPAYAWSHLHLTAKTSDNLYAMPSLYPITQTHPSDESRMRLLIHGLRILNLDEHAKKISGRWAEIEQIWGSPPPEYSYAYPDSLLVELATSVFNALRGAGFAMFTKTRSHTNSITETLDKAWDMFWTTKPREFRVWEEQQIDNLRSEMGVRNPDALMTTKDPI
jgi:hypothetical protein